jgi:hypothetical protein
MSDYKLFIHGGWGFLREEVPAASKIEMETEGSSETTVSVYKNTGRHNTQDHTINTHCRGTQRHCASVRLISQLRRPQRRPTDHFSLTRTHRKARPSVCKSFHLYVTHKFNVNLLHV